MKYQEPGFTEDDLVREHMGQKGEKKEDPNQLPPEGNTRPEFVYPRGEGLDAAGTISQPTPDCVPVDTNDCDEWSAVDVADLKASLENGSSIEEATVFLMRQGKLDAVKRKADELGLHYRSEAEESVASHKITNAE